MIDEVKVRARKSAKYGKTYEYRFEVAPIGGERKWYSEGGFCPKRKPEKLDWKNGNATMPVVCRKGHPILAMLISWMNGWKMTVNII